MSVMNYKSFLDLNEMPTRKKVCPLINLNDVRASEAYSDLISLGFKEERLPEPREGAGFSDQRERMGNIAFSHKTKTGASGYPQYMIKGDKSGTIRVMTEPNRSEAFWLNYKGGATTTRFGHSHRLSQRCMTEDDYIYKIGFLIKWILRTEGFPFDIEELGSSLQYKEAITEKIKSNPSLIKTVGNLPKSLAGEELAKALVEVNDFKIFDYVRDNMPELWKDVEKIMGDASGISADLGDLGF